MQERPVYLDLTKIRLPLSAFISITHRLSGMYVFFITLPLGLSLINKSIKSKSSFEELLVEISSVSFFSFFVLLSFQILLYHVLTGVRHLIMDFFHVGESLDGSYYSAILTVCLWFLLCIILIGYIFIL